MTDEELFGKTDALMMRETMRLFNVVFEKVKDVKSEELEEHID